MKEREIKILVVDDEPDFRKLMTFWLESKGYSVTAVSGGQEAIRSIKEETPDIVFLDLNMPVMDGPETLKEIRKFNKDLPVIIISAYVDDKVRVKQVTETGISGIFYKGTGFDEGFSIIETALRTHKRLKK